ncbi:MAG: hypothetical protein HYZ84_01035, partial [Candidatus Omnitrophica bacterium]|nr:hypothetical protein [Candidatus Omnitrophota bacterium]
EMNALFGSEKLAYQGIEDWDLYQENYLTYLRAIQVKPALLAKLAQSRKKLDEQRLRVYSAKLNEFHETINSFHEERLNLLELLKYLKGAVIARRAKSDEAISYPNLTILLSSIADEDAEREENLQKSVRRLAEEIKRHLAGKLSLQEEMTFHKNYQTYVTGQMESGAYLKFLVEAARKSGFTPKLTPLMLKAMGLEETLSMMKGKKVFEELEAFLQETENRLTVAMEEKQIAEEYRKIRLLKNVISLEATRDEVEESRKSEIASALLGALPRNDSSVIASERSASGSTSREARRERSNPVFNLYYASEFYRLVLKRDEAMHQNLEKLLAREKSGRIMVLAGGFHTAGFEKTLKEKHYNYAIITPNIRSLAGSEVYAEVMKGKFSFREEFEGDFYKAFHRHVSNELVSELNGPDFQNILKLWRDEIIRRLSREKRIEQAPDYTPYVDRLWPVYFEKYGSRSTRINFRKTKLLRMMRRESKRFVQEKIDRYLARLEKNPSASINGPLAASSIIQLAGLSFMPKTDVRSEIRNLIRTGEMPSISQETFSAEEGLIRRARSEARNLVSYTDLTEPEQKKVMGFGNKAAQLALLAQLGISVPPAMAVRLESIYRDFQEAEIIEEFKLIIRILEEKTGLEFGSPKKPLLLAVRSSPVESHPGRFDTVLNAGLTDQTVEALAEWGGEDFAYRSYVEFLQKYAESIFQISRTDPANRELFESSPDAGESWKTFAGRIRASRPMSAIPQDPYKQLIEVLNFILRGLNDVTSGTVLQEMVFGNLNDQSMSGVLTTRDVETGENELRGRFHRKATGRTVVSGDAGEDIAVLNEPEIVASLQEAKRKLEKATGYVQDMEFVVQSRGEGKRIVVVQTRNAPVANPATQIRILRDMNRERILDERVLAARIADLEKQKVQIFKASPESGTLPILVSGEGLGDMAVQGKVLSLAEIKSSAAAGILYIENPYTNEVLELIRTRRIIGLITSAKNRFSHLAMQARIMRIPVLFGVQGPFEHLGKNVLLDAAESVLREAQENKNYVEPFPGLIELPGMEEILEAEDVFNRLKAAGNMTSLDFKREHTNYLRELAALQPEASAENSSRALFLNALAHRIHEYIPELEKKEMEAGFLTGVTLWSREELDDVWREELGIDVNLRTISFYEDRPEDRPKIQRALEILKENVVHHPQVKAWIEKYGADNLRIEVSFRVGFETSRLPMFRVSVVLPSRVTRIYYRRIGVGYKHNMRNSYDKTPAVDTAIAEAQAVAQRHAGAEAIAYVHVEEWHERGVYDAYWDVSVYEPLDAAASEMRVIEQGQRLSRFFSHWFESWTAHYRSKAFAENAVENVGVVMLPARITSSLRQYLWPDEDSFYVGDRYGTKPEIWGTNTINVRTPSPRFFSWNSAILPQNKPVVEIGMSLKRENQGRKFISTFWRAVRESFSEKAVLMMRIQNISTLMSLAEALDQHSNNWDTLLTRIRDKRRYWDLPELSDSNLSVEDQIPAIRELIEDRQWLVRKLVEYLKSDQFNIEANRQRIFKALRESRLAAPMIRHLDDGNLRLVVTTDKRRGKVYEAVTVLFEPTADIARSEVRFQANVVAALQAAAHIGWDDLTNGDLQGAMDEAISNIYGGPAPPFTRPPALKLSDIIELMSENKAVIDPVMILPKVETEFGTIDLAYLNNVTLYEGEDAALRLARDLHLAHRLGLITIEKFKGVSPSTQTLKLLKEKGKQLKTIPITWSNGIVLRFKFSGLKTANTLMKYKGNDEQIKFYFEVFGRESARNKHAGALFSAISSLVPKELGWQRMDLNLGLAEDLREDFGRKLKEAGWIYANSGDGKQIDYYISFLKSNGIDARNKHAGALFSAISSLVPKELGWQVMQLNLGLAEDLRADFGRKLKEAGWIEANSGDGKQIDYYISFLKSNGIDARDKHAGALFSAISSLVPKELGWQRMDLNLGLAEDLRADFGRKLKEAGWINANSGDGKQIDYYLSFLKLKGINARDKHAGNLFSAISSLVPKELGWQVMQLNLGLAEDLREDFGRKLKEAGWIDANSGDGKQIDYYISFLKSNGIDA